MKIQHIFLASMVLLLGACSEAELPNGRKPTEGGLMPVLFSAGNMDAAVTRASASYMPKGRQFACAMFFHAGASDNNKSVFYSETYPLVREVNMSSASMMVDNEYGNVAYQQKDSTFYWQNRLNHVFLALTDNNQITSVSGVQVGDKVEFDLTRGDKTSMAQQPDPLLADTTQAPVGATAEANRVNLFFRHQFAQILVNLKNSQYSSNSIQPEHIEKVELIGVTATGYVTYGINSDGTVPAASFVPAPADNAFELFVREAVPTGYLKSFEGIAFGKLLGIRITWRENEDGSTLQHVATFQTPDDSHKNLQSGKKYIYNIELRRSLIAQVKAEILPWGEDNTSYTTDGTIDTTDNN